MCCVSKGWTVSWTNMVWEECWNVSQILFMWDLSVKADHTDAARHIKAQAAQNLTLVKSRKHGACGLLGVKRASLSAGLQQSHCKHSRRGRSSTLCSSFWVWWTILNWRWLQLFNLFPSCVEQWQYQLLQHTLLFPSPSRVLMLNRPVKKQHHKHKEARRLSQQHTHPETVHVAVFSGPNSNVCFAVSEHSTWMR